MARLGAKFVPAAPRLDRVQTGPWPKPLPPWFWTWAAWVDHGRPPGQRPPSAPAQIPKWAWLRYQLHKPVKPKPPPVTPAPPVTIQSRFAKAIIAAEDPSSAIAACDPTMPIFFTADPLYRDWVTADVLAACKSQRRPIGAWCNPAQVPPDALRLFALQIGVPADMLMGQGESAAEMAITLDARLPGCVGNLSSLTDDQRAAINAGRVEFVQEDYWNVMPWLVPDWMGVRCVGSCAGLYNGEGPYGRYVPLADFIGAGRYVRGRDGFYHAKGPDAAGHPQDYKLAA